MTRYLVEGDIRPGRKAELAARLKDGTLLQGSPDQPGVLEGLRDGHATGDTAYFVVEGDMDGAVREELEHYFDLRRVIPYDRVNQEDRDRIRGFGTNLPEWAGVDL